MIGTQKVQLSMNYLLTRERSTTTPFIATSLVMGHIIWTILKTHLKELSFGYL